MRSVARALFCVLAMGCCAISHAGNGFDARARQRLGAIVSESGMAVPEEVPPVVPPPPVSAPAPRPYVVIFKGKTICRGCETPFKKYFAGKRYGIKEVMPGESTPQLLAGAAVYIVPGGADVTPLEDGWTEADREAIRAYVRNGGRYYGVCLGGYWAGNADAEPGTIPDFEGLDVIPATVTLSTGMGDLKDKIVDVHWERQVRKAYYQGGPSFQITDPGRVLKIYATYDDTGDVATFLSKYERGKVLVSGIHVEATRDWYADYHLPAPPNLNRDLLDEVMDDLLKD